MAILCDNQLEAEVKQSYFEDPSRQRYDESWRAQRANRHRPSACGRLGKALAELRRPSGGWSIKEFRKSQALCAPSLDYGCSENIDLVGVIETSRPYTINIEELREEGVKAIHGEDGFLAYASYGYK